jgi:competence protein ComEC
MYKRLILPMLLAILLVACGQGIEQENHAVDTHTDTDNAQQADKQDKTTYNTDEKEEAKNETVDTENLPELKVHFIDVGQADATLFQFGAHAVLFDAGDWRGNEVVNYVKAQGVSKIDIVIGSHPDADHIGQLANVIETFEVDEVWLSGNESTSQTFQRGLVALLASNAGYVEPRAGDEFEIGSLDLKVLNPKSATGASNEESIAILFTYGQVKLILTGDADQTAEQQMMQSGIDLDADILKLGHHGSSTSSNPNFVKAVSPNVAIYSAGAGNSYGHPHAEVVSLIQKSGIKLYGTDVHGTIVISTDGEDYTIKTKKDGTITPKSTESPSKSQSNSTNNDGSKNNNNSSSTPSSSCININTASYQEVQRIKHIGPERAQDLIDLRPFSSVSDLTRINGIGPARIKDIQAEGLACVK